MSSELERRLEAMLADAPEPDPGAGEKALHRALHALQPATPSQRGLRTAVLVFATAWSCLLVIAAGSFAAAGALHVSLGAKPKPAHPASPLTLPQGANGVAAIIDGRLSVVTRDGGRLQVRATAAALSPRALYVAGGQRQLPRCDGAGWATGLVTSRRREGRSDRLGAGRLPDRVHRPRGASLRLARHLRERRPRHDDRPLGATGAAVVAGRLPRLRLRGRRREGDRLRLPPRVTDGRSSEPAGYRRRLRAPRGLAGRGGAERSLGLAPERRRKDRRDARGVRLAARPPRRRWPRPPHISRPPLRTRRRLARLLSRAWDRRIGHPKLVIVRLGQSLVSGTTTLATIPRRATVRDLTIG